MNHRLAKKVLSTLVAFTLLVNSYSAPFYVIAQEMTPEPSPLSEGEYVPYSPEPTVLTIGELITPSPEPSLSPESFSTPDPIFELTAEEPTATPSPTPLPSPLPGPEPTPLFTGGDESFSLMSTTLTSGVQTIVGSCIEDAFGKNLNCSANDVSISSVSGIVITDDGCQSPDDTVTFTATWDVRSTAERRYNVGLYFAGEGQSNALNGSCSVSTIPNSPTPPWYDYDGNTCGDIEQDVTLQPQITMTVQCTDPDGDNLLNLPYCTSWHQQDVACSGPSDAVPLNPAKCTCDGRFQIPITVPFEADIEVVKDLNPTEDEGKFNLLVNGNTEASCIGDGGSTGPITVGAGTSKNPGAIHTVEETVSGCGSTSFTDYSSAISCVNRGLTTFHGGLPLSYSGQGPLSVPVEKDDDIVCTITNTARQGTLVVKKVVNNSFGGTKTEADFSFSVNGQTAIQFEADGENELFLGAGTYTITESEVKGYQTSYDNCSDIELGYGETETCTITNSDIQPKLTITKTVDGGDLEVADFPLYVDTTLVISGEQNGFNAGGYIVSEDNSHSDLYDAQIGRDCAPDGSISLEVGDVKECTVTNTRKTGTITFLKITDDGSDPLAWTFSVSKGDQLVGTFKSGQSGVFDTGNYTVLETGPDSDYFLSSVSGACSNNSGYGADLLVTQSEDVCTFSNSSKGSITIIKDALPDDPQDFTFLASGAGLEGFVLDDDGETVITPKQKSFTGLLPGIYTISENDMAGWKQGVIDCGDRVFGLGESLGEGTMTVNLATGEDVTCTFTNKKLAKITLEKNTIGGDGTFEFTLSGSGLPESVNLTTIGAVAKQEFSNLDPDNIYSIIETVPTGWENIIASCDNGDFTTAISPVPGEEINCLFLNEKLNINLTKTANPVTVFEPGGLVTFTVRVGNASSVPVNLSSLTDDIYGNLNGKGSCSAPQIIDVESFYECSFVEYVEGDAGSTHTDLVTAFASGVSASDDATVSIADVVPSIIVTKTANPTSVPETGADVTFTYLVENTSPEEVTITSLVDDKFGILAGDADCHLGTILASGASCSFTNTFTVPAGDYPGSHDNLFTAYVQDNEDNSTQASDDASVAYIDVLPDISVIKSADQNLLPETGGNVSFNFSVTNNSSEDITITSLSDSIFGNLNGDTDCHLGTVLAAGTGCQFTQTHFISSDSLSSHYNVFTAEVTDNDGNLDSASDDETIVFTDNVPTIVVTKTANPVSVPETGSDVSFTFSVENNSPETVTILSLVDSVFGNLAGDGDCQIGTTLVPAASCTFSQVMWIEGDYQGIDHTNTFSVTAEDNDGTLAFDEDQASVSFEDVIPVIEVTKSANPSLLPETGGDVTFTFLIENKGEEDVTLTALTDTIFGNLNGEGDCLLPQTISVGGSYACSISRFLSSDSLVDHINIVTAFAQDDDQTQVTDSDDALVTFEDILPDISVTKTAGVSQIVETGGDVLFSYTVSNNSTEDAIITSLSDDKFGVLTGDGDCQVGTVLASGMSCSFDATFMVPAGEVPGSHINIFQAEVADGDGNFDMAADDAIVEYYPLPLRDIRITKSNDKSSDILAGTTIKYTLTVENTGEVDVYNLDVTDILPGGIEYVTDSAYVGGVKNEPLVSGNTKLTWNLGWLTVGQSLTITYEAKSGNDLTSGRYFNLASCKANVSERQGDLEAMLFNDFISREEQEETVECNEGVPVSSGVTIISLADFSIGIGGGQVLGAAIELPATGSETEIMIILLAILSLGVVLKLEGRKEQKNVK